MWKLFPFNNYFLSTEKKYTPEQMWDLAKASGYEKLYFSVDRKTPESWAAAKSIRANRERTGLGLGAAYLVVDLNDPDPAGIPTIEETMDQLEGGDILELALTLGWKTGVSDPSHDGKAIDLIERCITAAKSRGILLSLYHHFGFFAERIADCVRIAKRIDDPTLGVTFCGYHWYAVDRSDLAANLKAAAPYLRLVNVCGSRKMPEGWESPLPYTIEVVGAGDFPLGAFISGIREIGYRGDVGFQGYLIKGDAPTNLLQSIDAWRKAIADLR